MTSGGSSTHTLLSKANMGKFQEAFRTRCLGRPLQPPPFVTTQSTLQSWHWLCLDIFQPHCCQSWGSWGPCRPHLGFPHLCRYLRSKRRPVWKSLYHVSLAQRLPVLVVLPPRMSAPHSTSTCPGKPTLVSVGLLSHNTWPRTSPHYVPALQDPYVPSRPYRARLGDLLQVADRRKQWRARKSILVPGHLDRLPPDGPKDVEQGDLPGVRLMPLPCWSIFEVGSHMVTNLFWTWESYNRLMPTFCISGIPFTKIFSPPPKLGLSPFPAPSCRGPGFF